MGIGVSDLMKFVGGQRFQFPDLGLFGCLCSMYAQGVVFSGFGVSGFILSVRFVCAWGIRVEQFPKALQKSFQGRSC